MGSRVKIEGLKEVQDMLRKAAKMFTPDEIQKVLKEEAAPMVDTMQRLCGERTGRLANSIKVLPRENAKFPYTIIVGVDFTPDGKGTMTIAALASVREYGASRRVPLKNKSFKHVLIDGEWRTMTQQGFASIPPRPFIRPALDQHKASVTKGIITKLGELAERKLNGK